MTINVMVDGHKRFEWEGDEPQIASIIDRFPKGAQSVRKEPMEFAELCLNALYQGVLTSMEFKAGGRVPQEMLMMGVVWRILIQDTGHPEHPGRVADYAAHINFDIEIHRIDSKLSLQCRAYGQYNA